MPMLETGEPSTPPLRRAKRVSATLGDGRTVEIRPLEPGMEPTGFGELGRTVARMAGLDEVAALQMGVSVPVAWVAGVAGGRDDLGIAWFTTLVGSPQIAAAEVRLASDATRLGLGPMLLDTVVLAATERGVTHMTMRLAEGADDYLPALGRYGARFSWNGDRVVTAELSLATGRRRFHWSGMHRRVTAPMDAP
jgi:hypothetical protein